MLALYLQSIKFCDWYLGSMIVFCALCVGAIGQIRESVHVKLSVLENKAMHKLADQECQPPVRPNLAAPTWASAQISHCSRHSYALPVVSGERGAYSARSQ